MAKVAVPPLIDKAKSLVSKEPLPALVLYTTSPKVIAMVPLLAARAAAEIVGTVWSIVIVVLLKVPVAAFPAASVNIAVKVTTPASAKPVKASSWAAVMDTVLFSFIADIVAASPRLA